MGKNDVKNLKLKIRDGEEIHCYNPWNIAVNFGVDMSFNSKELRK